MQKYGQRPTHDFRSRKFGLLHHFFLGSSGHAFDHRIDRLEMTRVGRQRQAYSFAIRSFPFTLGTLVIFDVTFVRRERGMDRTLECSEDPLTEVSDDVGQY